MNSPRLRAAAVALLAAAAAVPVSASEVAAVLGSDLAPYREAFAGFTAAYGAAVTILPLGAKPSKDVRVIVAFGGKAALQRYPARATLVYGVAPGVRVDAQTHEGPVVQIPMEPAPDVLLRRLTGLQPGLKRLGVLWTSPGGAESAESLKRSGTKSGVTVVVERLESGDDLPDALRRLKDAVDALWLPPDPLVINARNFETIKRYAYDNDVPFYVPTEALVEKGAAASVSVSYEEAGRVAAAATKDALAGKPAAAAVFVQNARVSLNRAAAAECGLVVGRVQP